MTMTVTQPTHYGDPFTISISAVPPTYPVVTVWRMGPHVELVQGTPLVLSSTGSGVVTDALYPLEAPFAYELRNGDGSALIETAGPFTPPQPAGDEAGRPQIIDVTTPGKRSAVEIIDVTSRTRRGRVTVFQTVGVAAFTTVGDVRLLSEGTLTILFRSHVERDDVIATLSSGGPVVMRVPTACQIKLDEMWFTPQDVVEERLGLQGGGFLSVDFVEVQGTPTRPLPPSVEVVSYATQTANAAAAGQTYSGQSIAFVGGTYETMKLSGSGIAP
jgi:hypothetical protein